MGSIPFVLCSKKGKIFTNELKLPIVKLIRQQWLGERKGKFEFSGRFYVLEDCALFYQQA
jgi:hypothetical protein